MSTNIRTEKVDVSRETVEEIMKQAHRERAEAIAELFGFGFTVVKDTVKNGFGHRATTARTPFGDGTARS